VENEMQTADFTNKGRWQHRSELNGSKWSVAYVPLRAKASVCLCEWPRWRHCRHCISNFESFQM